MSHKRYSNQEFIQEKFDFYLKEDPSLAYQFLLFLDKKSFKKPSNSLFKLIEIEINQQRNILNFQEPKSFFYFSGTEQYFQENFFPFAMKNMNEYALERWEKYQQFIFPQGYKRTVELHPEWLFMTNSETLPLVAKIPEFQYMAEKLPTYFVSYITDKKNMKQWNTGFDFDEIEKDMIVQSTDIIAEIKKIKPDIMDLMQRYLEVAGLPEHIAFSQKLIPGIQKQLILKDVSEKPMNQNKIKNNL